MKMEQINDKDIIILATELGTLKGVLYALDKEDLMQTLKVLNRICSAIATKEEFVYENDKI